MLSNIATVISTEISPIHDVEVGPDGLLYVLTDADDGHVWRSAPLDYEGDQ